MKRIFKILGLGLVFFILSLSYIFFGIILPFWMVAGGGSGWWLTLTFIMVVIPIVYMIGNDIYNDINKE